MRTEADIEKTRDLMRKLESDSGDGLCHCNQCEYAVADALAQERAAAYKRVTDIAAAHGFTLDDERELSVIGGSMKYSEVEERTERALAAILRAAQPGTTDTGGL